MSGIIAFFKRFYFLVLFLALECLAMGFVFTNNYEHQAGFFNSSNTIAGSVYSAFSRITAYFSLNSQDKQLKEENAMLRNSISGIKDTSSHHPIQKINPYGQQFNFIPAEVIDNSTNLPDNYITLNAGWANGIEEGMGVISPNGIVGIVLKTSEHYSVVMSLLHNKCLVSVMFKKSGTFGTLSRSADGDYRYALLSQIPMSEKVKAGDTIVTSGYSNIFPKGIPVGQVESFKPIPEQYFFSIKVRLSTDFKNLRYVYAVKDIMKIEKTVLEDDAKKP